MPGTETERIVASSTSSPKVPHRGSESQLQGSHRPNSLDVRPAYDCHHHLSSGIEATFSKSKSTEHFLHHLISAH